jgi:hypothetical protein
MIIAVAVNTEGRPEVLGMATGPSEAEPFRTEFLRSLMRRGLRGVRLVISDAHGGPKAAVAKVLSATWQRCRFVSGARRSLETEDASAGLTKNCPDEAKARLSAARIQTEDARIARLEPGWASSGGPPAIRATGLLAPEGPPCRIQACSRWS